VALRGTEHQSEFVVDYNAGDIGKTAHIRGRWFNRKGEPARSDR